MNFENFIEEIKKMVKDYLGGDTRVETKSVLKNNGIKMTGIVILEGKQNCVPNIYLNGYFEQYKRGRCLYDIVCEIANYYKEHKIEQQVNIAGFSQYEKIKDSICFRLINYEKNEELLKQIPYIPYLDLAIVFYCVIQNECIGDGNILIRNEHLKKWNVDEKSVQAQAFYNSERLFKGTIRPMEDVICELMRKKMICEIEKCIEEQMDAHVSITEEMVNPILKEMMYTVYSEAKGPKMYVVSNESKNFGAAAILYDSFLKDFANQTKSDYYILPSSIHEVILVPVQNEENEVVRLQHMVYEVNHSELDSEEILSDSIYLFKRSAGIITKLQ